MKTLVLTSALACLLGASAFASLEKVTATVETSSKKSVYHRSDSAGADYQQVSAYSVSKYKYVGTGPLSAINQEKPSPPSIKVPGIDYKGHSRVSLTREDNGSVYLNFDIAVDDLIDGHKVDVSSTYRLPVEFKKGSWADYQAGKDVELQVTEAGQKISEEQSAAAVQKAVAIVRDSLASQLADAGVSELRIEKVESKGRGKIRGNLDRLEIEGAPGKYVLAFTVDI
jgi:hypothetical protein